MLKGQAAMEYIVTYGWALLGLVILIGALTYFGVFNPEDTLPDKCYLNKDLECLDHQIISDSSGEYVKLIVKNLKRNDVYISNITCTLGNTYSVDPLTSVSLVGDYDGTNYGILPTNAEVEITCGGVSAEQFSKDSKRKVLINLEYFEDVDFKKIIKGDVFSKVR